MEYIKTDIEGPVILRPRIIGDSRGYFAETFRQDDFDRNVRPVRFVQDNESRSQGNVIRGLHLQTGAHAQAKLVRCVQGAVLDVAVDLREGSPTFGRHIAVELSEDNHCMLFIPRGFAHGFAVLGESATFQYKCDNYYHPESEAGINPFDPALAIQWPFDPASAIVSEKDKLHPILKEADKSIFLKTDE